MFIDNKLLYKDVHHISTLGEQFIVSQIKKSTFGDDELGIRPMISQQRASR
jgi:hypothetical protein